MKALATIIITIAIIDVIYRIGVDIIIALVIIDVILAIDETIDLIDTTFIIGVNIIGVEFIGALTMLDVDHPHVVHRV
jgi:hypothetical protein